MINKAKLLSLFDHYCRVEIEYPGMRKDVLPNIVRFYRPAPGMSFILYSSLDEITAEAAIDEQVAYFRRMNQPLVWKVFDYDQPADLAARLAVRGFQVEEREAVMLLDLSSPPASLLEKPQADIRPITSRDQLKDVVAVEEQVWGENFDWIYDRLGEHLEIPGYLSVYVAYVEGEPASAAWIYMHKDSPFADLWGGSTIDRYRKKGLYTDLLAVRVQEAIQRGYRYLTIDASPMSQPIVARHGFEVLAYAVDCEWQPEGSHHPEEGREG